MPSVRTLLFSALISVMVVFVSHAEPFNSEAEALAQMKTLEEDYQARFREKISLVLNINQQAQQHQWRQAEVRSTAFLASLYGITEEFELAEQWIATFHHFEPARLDHQSRSAVLGAEMFIASLRGDTAAFAQLKPELNRLIETFTASGDEHELANLLYEFGNSFISFGRYEEAIKPLKQTIRLHRKNQRYYELNNANNSLALVYGQLNDHRRALEIYLALLNDDRVELNGFDRSISFYNIGISYGSLEQYQLALDYLNQARELSVLLKDNIGIAYADLMLAKHLLLLEQYEQALVQLDGVATIITEQHNLNQFIALSGYKVEALVGIQRLEQARDLLTEMERLTATHPEYQGRIHLLTYKLEYAQQHHKAAQAAYQAFMEFEVAEADKSRESSMQSLLVEFGAEQAHADKQLLEQTNQLNQAQLDKAKYEVTILYLFGGITVALGLAVVLFWFRERANRQKIQQVALRDFLTGSPNRRAVMNYAHKCLSASIRNGQPLSLAIVDLDHFKLVNDSYGHNIGDRVLQEFTKICVEELRDEDQYGRFGGEEWLLVFPATEVGNLALIFERLRKRLRNVNIEGVDDNYVFSFSMGAAQWNREFGDLDALIKAADENVYKAKELGRDQLVIPRRDTDLSNLRFVSAQ